MYQNENFDKKKDRLQESEKKWVYYIHEMPCRSKQECKLCDKPTFHVKR